MKIHVFNPEHDLALAHNGKHFTAPHAARELRAGLGYIPALWAADGDIVLVDDAKYAHKAAQRYHSCMAKVVFMTPADLLSTSEVLFVHHDVAVSVWGWDMAIRQQLLESGVPMGVLPSVDAIARMRELSGRKTSVEVLSSLTHLDGTVGESICCVSMPDLLHVISMWGNVVLKAPWSSSGRGIKYVNAQMTSSQEGWCHRVMKEQGYITAERYCNKVVDFAMEFYAHSDGRVDFMGLSLFHTKNGAYVGNLLAPEGEKMKWLMNYIPVYIINNVKEQLQKSLEPFVRDVYVGPLGVDMMVVSNETGNGFLLNPCVEVNLRRTMGHVALSLSSENNFQTKVMRIVHEANYVLKCMKLELNN